MPPAQPGTVIAQWAHVLSSTLQHRLGSEQRGSVTVEYLVLLVFAGVLVVAAVVPVLGPSIIEEYSIRHTILYSSFP